MSLETIAAEFVGGLVWGFALGLFLGFVVVWQQWVVGVLVAVVVIFGIAGMVTMGPAEFGAGFLSPHIPGVFIGVWIGSPVGKHSYRTAVGEVSIR